MESTAQAINKISNEMSGDNDVETQTSTAISTMEAYFDAEKTMQNALKSAHDACECEDKVKRSTNKGPCSSAIRSFITAEQDFYSEYHSYSGTIGGVYTKLKDVVDSADPATVTAATKKDILDLLTHMKNDAETMDTWEDKLTQGKDTVMKYLELKRHQKAKDFCDHVRNSDVPSIATATCKQSSPTPYSSSSTAIVTTDYGTMTISTCTSSS